MRAEIEADSPFRVRFCLPPTVTMTQDEFFELCQQNDGIWFERTAEGDLIVSSPRGGLTGMQYVSVGAQLHEWAKRTASGMALGSSTGFILPNGANRTAAASWISPKQLATITQEQKKKFVPVCPCFIVEILSPTDRFSLAQAKMEEYAANGCKLGWLIDPDRTQVHVYRPGQPVQVLDNPQTLAGDPELPGFVLDLEPVWRP